MSEMVKEIYSPSRKHRVIILKKDNGQYTLETHSFYGEMDDWENTSFGLHLFETYELAEEGAKEILRNESGENIE